MTSIADIIRINFDGARLSADEMRDFVAWIEAHFIGTDSSASAAELYGVLSARQCNEYLNDDDQAEAMRRGFRLAMYLAKFDFPLVQRAIRQERQGASVAARQVNLEDRNARLRADHDKLALTHEPHQIVREIKQANKYNLSERQIRDIIKSFKKN